MYPGSRVSACRADQKSENQQKVIGAERPRNRAGQSVGGGAVAVELISTREDDVTRFSI